MKFKKWHRKKEFNTETLTQYEADIINEEIGDDIDDEDMPLYEDIPVVDDDHLPRPFTPEDDDYDDIMQMFGSSPTKPKYWYEDLGEYWSCSCGNLNKGDYCTNCGLERELLESLFFLHKPGDAPGEYEGMPVKYEEVIVHKGKLSSKQKLILAIASVVILLICAGLFSYFNMIKPAMEKEAAQNNKKIAEAIDLSVNKCADNISSLTLNSLIGAGDICLSNKKYENAIEFYNMSLSLNDSDKVKEKINDAKFGYVSDSKNKGNDTFKKYLTELKEAKYPGIDDIYYSYYQWKFSVVTNLAPEDYSGDVSTVSRNDIVYFHISAGGGPPNETIDVYYEAIWPSGNKEVNDLGKDWTSSSRETVRLFYRIPRIGKEGKLTFNVYDAKTKKLLASDSVTFKK